MVLFTGQYLEMAYTFEGKQIYFHDFKDFGRDLNWLPGLLSTSNS
jgi:hypothetical protein